MSVCTDDEALARALVQARRSGQPLDAAAHALQDADQAYRVQARVAQAMGWFAEGPPRHWKSGGPRRDGPLTHAALPPAGVWVSPAAAGAWPFHFRGIEAEIALRLGRAVDADQAAMLDTVQALACVDALAVAIEIVDSRWMQRQDAPPWHRLADLQSHGALVLGDWQPLRPIDWSRQRCTVQIGERRQAFTGTHSLGDPAWLLPQWLRHATRGGARLPAGTVVTTGTWCGLLMAQPGEAVRVVFDAIGEARVAL